jgi:hypothetical protein
MNYNDSNDEKVDTSGTYVVKLPLSLRICIYRGIQIASIFLFIQNELALNVERVGSEYMNKTATSVVLATPLDFFLWGVLKERVSKNS